MADDIDRLTFELKSARKWQHKAERERDETNVQMAECSRVANDLSMRVS